MKTLIVLAISALVLAGAPLTAHADETITVMADSPLDGNAGLIVHSVSTEGDGQSIFVFEDTDKLRICAFRAFGPDTWDVEAMAQ